MAKRKRPDPAITEKHVAILRPLSLKLEAAKKLATEAQEELAEAVRTAFEDGMLVGPMKEATGKSGSRLYQHKFATRDQKDVG